MRRQEVRCLPGALKAWRKQREWSQKDLSEHTGGNVSPTMIAMIETGDRQPSRLNAEDIASALGVPLEAIAFVYPDEMVTTVEKASA